MTRKNLTKKFADNELYTAFGGVCFHCRKQGHRANKRPQILERYSVSKMKRNKIYKNCLKCGKRRHLAKECWSKNQKNE
jgi:hypothetical protein